MERGIDRRSFIGAGLAGAVAVGRAPAAHRDKQWHGLARNVIFLVSDGMSIGTLQLADAHLFRRHGRRSQWRALWDREGVHRAMQQTYSADGWVTDSAAAGSAWGTGVHVNNGSINTLENGIGMRPILVRAREDGRKTGLVTTTRVTHATPAAFVADVPKRTMEDEIARQMLDRGVDLILGGGAKHFPDELLARHTGVAVVRTRDELLAGVPGDKALLGLFTGSHMSYEIDRVSDKREDEPTLMEMTRAALGRLDNPDGFILQIEGGRVDHAAHDNDAGGLIHDQIAFDDALRAVVEFAEGRDDTLVIVTTDHGNANPGLTVYGEEGRRKFDGISKLRHSFEWILARYEQGGLAALPDAIEEATGDGFDREEFEMLRRAGAGERVDPFELASGFYMVLGSLMANRHGVAFLSPNHTSDFVETTAFGPGSERITGFIDNIELHGIMSESLDLPPV